MFRNLCGAENYKNVVVLTTFWDKIPLEEATMRENVLKSKFFKELVDGHTRFMRHDRTVRSAHDVLSHIYTLTPTNVQIQQEIRVEGNRLKDTAAGSVHRKELERMIAKHREEANELKVEMNAVKWNGGLVRELQEEEARVRRQLAKWEKERSELENGLDD